MSGKDVIASWRIVFRHDLKKLFINEWEIALTRKEYALCRLFLAQRNVQLSLSEETPEHLWAYHSTSAMQQAAGIANRTLLHRHVSNVNAKLTPLGIHLVAFGSEGYILSCFSARPGWQETHHEHPCSS